MSKTYLFRSLNGKYVTTKKIGEISYKNAVKKSQELEQKYEKEDSKYTLGNIYKDWLEKMVVI